jgi:hypothetical protein
MIRLLRGARSSFSAPDGATSESHFDCVIHIALAHGAGFEQLLLSVEIGVGRRNLHQGGLSVGILLGGVQPYQRLAGLHLSAGFEQDLDDIAGGRTADINALQRFRGPDRADYLGPVNLTGPARR